MNNIIDDGANIIGRVEDVVEFFKKELTKQIEDIEFEIMESNDVENVKDNVDKTIELINGLFQDYITEELSSDTMIKVNYDNNFGELLYTIYDEKKTETAIDMVGVGMDFQEKTMLSDMIKRHYNVVFENGDYYYAICNIHKEWKKWDKDVYKMSDSMSDSMYIYIQTYDMYIKQELSAVITKKDNN